MRYILRAVVCAAAALAMVKALNLAALAAPRTCTIAIATYERTEVTVTAEIADTDELRSRGLMFRKSLPEMSGMLFVFPVDRYQQFWMKNTPLPLDIAYISADGVINEIYHMKPLDISVTYPSRFPARYALEMNQGWFARHRIVPGARVRFHGCVSQ